MPGAPRAVEVPVPIPLPYGHPSMAEGECIMVDKCDDNLYEIHYLGRTITLCAEGVEIDSNGVLIVYADSAPERDERIDIAWFNSESWTSVFLVDADTRQPKRLISATNPA